MRARVQQVIGAQPDDVVVMGGTNDAFAGIPVKQVGDHLTAIVDQLMENSRASILIGLPIPLAYQTEERLLQTYRAWMRRFAQGRHLAVIDFYTALLDPQTGGILARYNLDGIHPNREGFERMAAEAFTVLKEFLRQETD